MLRCNKTRILVALLAGLVGPAASAFGGDGPTKSKFPAPVVKHLQRIYDEKHARFRFRADYPGGPAQWQKDFRPALRKVIGLDRIAETNRQHTPRVKLGPPKDIGKYTRLRGTIETEPHVRIPFWLLRPKGKGPFPLAVLPHGHDAIGHDTTAGVTHNEAHRKRIAEGGRDVAVQAVGRGFLAIAPATRGLAVDGVPDAYRRHKGSTCLSHAVHCMLAGRTAIGERVWDMHCILDWALRRDDVDRRRVLMMGNSGGGMVTVYAAACDTRITVAVPSCSFSRLVADDGRIYHCDCNLVPGILAFGELYDVAGLIAPRYLLAVNGRKDRLHSVADIRYASARVAAIYRAAGCPERFASVLGDAGHRFYPELMWPFVTKATGASPP